MALHIAHLISRYTKINRTFLWRQILALELVNAFAPAMEDCLARASEDLVVMGDPARVRALERHSVDALAERPVEIFRRSSRAQLP